jgi:hypothetical protein
MAEHHAPRSRIRHRTVKLALASAAACLSVAAAEPAAAQTPLDDAPVPSLCGHPAGTLVGGELPGIPENEGHVTLAAPYQAGMIQTGTIRADGDYVAVLSCSRGGVAWPQNLVFYDAAKQIIGAFDLYDITKGGRESVGKLAISGRTVVVDVVGIERDGDLASGGTGSARLKIRWDAEQGRLRVVAKRMFTERPLVRKFLRAVNRGRRQAAGKLAAPRVVREFFDARRRGARFRGSGCEGRLSDEWWVAYLESAFDWSRACMVSLRYRPHGEQAWALKVSTHGMHGFRITGVQGVAG